MDDLDKITGNIPLGIKRGLAVKLIKLGISLEDISKTLNVTASFIKKWRAIYHKEGTINFEVRYRGSQGLLNVVEQKK